MRTLILIGCVGLLSACGAGVDDQTGLALLREPIATLTDAVVAQDMARIIPATRDVVAVYEAVSGR
jgi:hypothetical protein